MDTAVSDEAGESKAFDELRAMILDDAVPCQSISSFLDALGDDLRPGVVRRMGPKEQKRLYERAAGFRSVQLIDLVPPDQADLQEVRHFGRNTLPAFRIFEKRFCRLPGEDASSPEALAGYNHQTMSLVTGPGYFMARNDPATAEVLVDYGRLPTQKPGAWPDVRPNERGLSRFVYGFMVDRLRRVSEHVTIGSAARKGRDMGSYFVLSRSA